MFSFGLGTVNAAGPVTQMGMGYGSPSNTAWVSRFDAPLLTRGSAACGSCDKKTGRSSGAGDNGQGKTDLGSIKYLEGDYKKLAGLQDLTYNKRGKVAVPYPNAV